MALAATITVLASTASLADEQHRWTGYIDNKAYLERYYGKSPEPVSTYAGGSSTGYSHRPGYGGTTTIVVETTRRNSYGVEYRNGYPTFFYADGYRPNYSRPYKRVYAEPRHYYRPGYPKYKKHYHYKYGKPHYGKPHYGKPYYGKPHPERYEHRKYVAPGYPGYKPRYNQQYRKHRIHVPRPHGYSTHRGGSRR